MSRDSYQNDAHASQVDESEMALQPLRRLLENSRIGYDDEPRRKRNKISPRAAQIKVVHLGEPMGKKVEHFNPQGASIFGWPPVNI